MSVKQTNITTNNTANRGNFKEKTMNAKKEYIGHDSRSFFQDGMKHTVEMCQLSPEMIPLVVIWTGYFNADDSVLLSRGFWNGISYICKDDDDPNIYDDTYEKINSLCLEMVPPCLG